MSGNNRAKAKNDAFGLAVRTAHLEDAGAIQPYLFAVADVRLGAHVGTQEMSASSPKNGPKRTLIL